MESEPALEDYLKSAPYHYVRDLTGGGGSGLDKKVLILRGGVAVAAKPGHTPDYAHQAKCEVAAWLLSAELEMTKLVPTTVLRPVPAPGGGEVEGSAQVLWARFVVAEQNFTHTSCPDDVAWLIAVFDCLAANTDRNDGNWGAITQLPDAVLVDHGLCFTRGPTTSPFFAARRGDDLPDDVRAHVNAFLATSGTTRLHEVLDVHVVQEVIGRAQHLVDTGKLLLP
jgi:hypothetical protein